MAARGNQFTSFAEDNFSRSGSSGLYDRARPSYPQPALDKILSLLPSSSTVVELGAGSGIFTRGFLATALKEEEGKVKELIAVEPSKGMREGWEKKIGEVEGLESSGVKVEIQDGLFDKIPVEDGKADLVVIAQAFHWIGSNGESAIRDMARVLKPNGIIALIWNLEDRTRAWVAELRDSYEKHEAGTPQARLGLWKSIFETEFYAQTYEEAKLEQFHRNLPSNEQGVVDRILSKSYITALSEEEQQKVAQEMREIVKKGEGKKWIDEKEGTFEYPYNTDLYIIRKKA